MNRDQLAACILIAIVSASFAGGVMLAYLGKPFPIKWAVDGCFMFFTTSTVLVGTPCCIGWSIAWLVIKLRT